jgi:hypothetical protein
MKNLNRRTSSEAKLEQAADEAFQKLISMDEKAFGEFIDSHRDGDIAQLLLYGNAFATDEFTSCCQFNERVSSWRFALSVIHRQTIAGTIMLQGTVGSRQRSTSPGSSSYSIVQQKRETYSWAA